MDSDKKKRREALGDMLRAFRGYTSLSPYASSQVGKIRVEQAQAIESGDKNYTIDAFLGYLFGNELEIVIQRTHPMKRKYNATVSYPMLGKPGVMHTGVSGTMAADSLEEVKFRAELFIAEKELPGNYGVTIIRNNKEYPEFDWVDEEVYNVKK